MPYNPSFDPQAILEGEQKRRTEAAKLVPGMEPSGAPPRLGELISDEAMLGRIGLLQTVAGGGFMPGQRGQLEADVNRQLGLRTATERALMNRRLASSPGMQDTAFGDALQRQLVTGQQNALAGYLSNLDQAALDRQMAALQALFASERESGARRSQEKMAKQAALSGGITGLAAAGGALAGELLTKKPKEESPTGVAESSIDFKRDIKDLDQNKIKQLLGAVNQIDLKKFRYKPGIEDGGAMEKMGMMAENAPPEVVTPDGKGIDMMSLIAMLIGSVQQISKELDLYKKFASRKSEVQKATQS